MKRLNEVLIVLIFILTAILAATVGFKAYQLYDEDRRIAEEQEEMELAQVLARNKEAQDRVQEMEMEIQQLAENPEELQRFIAEIQNAELAEPDYNVMSENNTVSDNDTVSDNSTVSNNAAVSENSVMSDNSTISGNDTVSGNAAVSDNSTVSANESADGDDHMTLEERRLLRPSLEETWRVSQKDRLRIAESRTDFSGTKIACLGDSITAAANLENEENYRLYAYPERLKKLLGAEEVYNLGIGGSSIGRYWADAYVDRYQDIPEDADIIIVMGGTNDGFCVSDKEFGNLDERAERTFCGDLDELMSGLREHYPDADIFFVTPLPNVLHDYLMSERDYLLPQQNFADVILTLAREYDYEVIDLYNSNILDSHDAAIVENYIPDGVHGNHEGYQIIAEHFAAELIRYYEDTD